MKNWSLGSRITALSIGVAVLLSMIAATAALTAAASRSDVTHLIDRIGPARTNTIMLTSVALTQHASIRQYAGTGRQEHLDQYRKAVEEEARILADNERLLVDEPQLRVEFRALVDNLRGWRTEVAEPLLATVERTGPDTALAAQDEAARARFAEVTGAIEAFLVTMTAIRDDLRRDVRQQGNLLIVLLVTAGAVVLIAGYFVSALLRRVVSRPVTQLAEEVRAVARGEYEREIRPVGPPEVARLARDVDAMRRQIVSDLGAVRDARQEVEAANLLLSQQADELTRSNRDLEQFAYVASHDLQEPLRKVASFCQLLQRRYAGQLDERADQYIYFAVDGAQRMQRLINDLLAFSRIGRITSGFVDVDLNKVVADIAEQRETRDSSIVWSELPVVRGEEPLLTALLSNLIGNSLKFRRTDMPPRVEVGAERRDDEWELWVKDNGIGIERDFADKIFVIFQRLHSKEAYPGTGIGLAMSKKIVEYHGGRIWLDTDNPDGTLIRFTLPVPAPTDAEAEDTPPTSELVAPSGATIEPSSAPTQEPAS